MYDLIVIGGGPGGTAAAITAARKGATAKILLLERGRLPRNKVCGEFVSTEALGLLAELLDPSCAVVLAQALRIARARVFLDGRVLRATLDPAAASITRFDLDQALWNSAQRSGVEAMQQVTVKKITGSSPFRVTTSVGDFEARAVVNASGRWSNLTTTTATNAQSNSKWIGLKAHFAESCPPSSVDLYFFEDGYCGVQPLVEGSKGRINVCAMVRAVAASTLPEVFQLHSALRDRAARWQPLMETVSVAPLLFAKPRSVAHGILLVGDAAGFVDPFVGDGISLALRGGAMAGNCLSSFLFATATLDDATKRYATEYQRQLVPVFRASSRIRRMLLIPRALRIPIVSVLAKAPAMSTYLVKKTR
jgi:menaquinone-9 beta-reductase